MIYLLILAVIIIGEFFLKNYIEAVFSSEKKKYILNNKILVHKYHNKGAFLNIMETKRRLLLAISVFFTLIITLLFIITLCRKGNHILKLGLTLLLGGSFSNTYDRLSRGYVVDYFSFVSPFKKLNTVVFNISDFCILVGSLLTVLGVPETK